MDLKQQNEIRIIRLCYGGYVVMPSERCDPLGLGYGMYATGDVDAALAFVKNLLTFDDQQKQPGEGEV